MSDLYPDDVTKWLKDQGLDGYYSTYIKLVRNCLAPENLSVCIQHERIIVSVDVAGTAGAVYAREDQFIEACRRTKQNFSYFSVSINRVNPKRWD